MCTYTRQKLLFMPIWGYSHLHIQPTRGFPQARVSIKCSKFALEEAGPLCWVYSILLLPPHLQLDNGNASPPSNPQVSPIKQKDVSTPVPMTVGEFRDNCTQGVLISLSFACSLQQKVPPSEPGPGASTSTACAPQGETKEQLEGLIAFEKCQSSNMKRVPVQVRVLWELTTFCLHYRSHPFQVLNLGSLLFIC